MDNFFKTLYSDEIIGVLRGCLLEPLTFALRESFHPSIPAATVNAYSHQTSVEAMAYAINQAIAAIQRKINTKTDPLTLFVNELLEEFGIGQS